MGGQAFPQLGAAGHVDNGGADILADENKVYPGPFCRLVLGRGEGGGRAFALTEMGGKLVGHLGLALGTQGGEDGQIVRPGNDGMAQQKFDLAGDLFMPGMIVAR